MRIKLEPLVNHTSSVNVAWNQVHACPVRKHYIIFPYYVYNITDLDYRQTETVIQSNDYR